MNKPLCKIRNCRQPIKPLQEWVGMAKGGTVTKWVHAETGLTACFATVATPYAKDIRSAEQARIDHLTNTNP